MALRINRCTNPSFEVSTAGWGVAGGATITRAGAPSWPGAGVRSLLVEWVTGVAYAQSASYGWAGLTIGAQYTASCYLYVPAASISTAPCIRIASPISLSGDTVTAADTWTRSSVTFTATATSHTVAIVTTGAATTGQYAYVDAVLLEDGATVRPYFDGASTDGGGGYRTWTGTAHLSTSQEYRYLTATAEPAATPQPRISVEVSSWSDGPIEVYRVHPDGTRHRIYCPDVSGGVSQVYDYSAPFDGDVMYQAQGATLYDSNTVDLAVADAWLSVPGLPELAVAAEITTKPARSRDRMVGRAYPHGRSTPITRGGALRSASMPVQVRTHTEADADALADVLEAQTRLLLRMPGVGARRSWQHVDVSGVSEDPAVHFTAESGAAADDVGWWLVHDIACTVAGDPPAVPFGDPTASYDLLLSPDGSTTRTYQQQLDWKRAGGTTYLEWLKGGFV